MRVSFVRALIDIQLSICGHSGLRFGGLPVGAMLVNLILCSKRNPYRDGVAVDLPAGKAMRVDRLRRSSELARVKSYTSQLRSI